MEHLSDLRHFTRFHPKNRTTSPAEDPRCGRKHSEGAPVGAELRAVLRQDPPHRCLADPTNRPKRDQVMKAWDRRDWYKEALSGWCPIGPYISKQLRGMVSGCFRVPRYRDTNTLKVRLDPIRVSKKVTAPQIRGQWIWSDPWSSGKKHLTTDLSMLSRRSLGQ